MKFLPVSNCDDTIWRVGIDEIDWAAGKNSCGCSFNVLPARLLHMTYPDYLKYMRANGAELYGHSGYVYTTFKNKENCQKICSKLNVEWDKIKKYVED